MIVVQIAFLFEVYPAILGKLPLFYVHAEIYMYYAFLTVASEFQLQNKVGSI